MKPVDIIVVGGGPAGIFAAGFAALEGARVLLLEKNRRCGAKLLLTGKGRCNLTHDESDPRRLCTAFGPRGKSLLTALYAFDVEATIDFFRRRDLALTVERGARVFPARGRAADVQRVLDDFLRTAGVSLRTACPVKKLIVADNRIKALETAQGTFSAERFVFATGGLSYPETGCTGDGYRWAGETGHRLVEPQPALVPLRLQEDWTREVSRFNLKNVRIQAVQDKKILSERFGEAFFTRDGIGGPIILDLSATVRDALKQGAVSLLLDLKPAVAPDLFDKRLLREFEAQGHRDFRNALAALLPQALIPLFVRLSGIAPQRKCHSITRAERRTLLQLFKNLPLRVAGVGDFSKAIVTSGGVSLRDIDMRTMRSQQVENLYFAGEMIDLDGPTGGYNLQLCWSTGYLAGISAAK